MGANCRFYGKNVPDEIKKGLSGQKNVEVRKKGCEGNCDTAPNAYLRQGDNELEHFTFVGRRDEGHSNPVDVVIQNIKTKTRKTDDR